MPGDARTESVRLHHPFSIARTEFSLSSFSGEQGPCSAGTPAWNSGKNEIRLLISRIELGKIIQRCHSLSIHVHGVEMRID